MYKRYAYKTTSGTQALVIALKEIHARRVIIPSYTCTDILNAVRLASCEYYIADCDFDLQIDCEAVMQVAKDYDSIIIPHMFGIRANVEFIRKNTDLRIIEDLSQCHGLPNLGKYADIVVASTNRSKWLNFGGGGLVFADYKMNLNTFDFSSITSLIDSNLKRRNELAQELVEAGIQLIGNESSWLRGMYFTDNSPRRPYEPLHTLVSETFVCDKINSYINNVNWISIIV